MKPLEVIREKDNVKFKDSESWKIFDSGNIKLGINDNEKQSEYRIKLAFCDNKEINDNKKIKKRKLFVYLPTDVNFPFLFIAHATFELDPSRKHLMASDINKCIAGKLAEFIVKTANVSIKDINNPWNALIFVTPQNIGTIEGQTDLEKLGFKKKLIASVSSSDIEIIPNLNRTFKSKENLKWLDANFNDLLKGDQFEDVCLYPEQDYLRDLSKFLKEDINITPILYEELRKKINDFLKENPYLSINDRADIIFRLIDKWENITGDTKNAIPPELLIDQKDKPITCEHILLPPPDGKSFELESWVPLGIVKFELITELKKKLHEKNKDYYFENKFIKIFNMKLYNIDTVIESIIKGTKIRIEEKNEGKHACIRDMLGEIWKIYSHKPKKNYKYTGRNKPELPIRGGSFRPADEVYLGKEYPDGELLEYLYEKLNGPFVEKKEFLGLEERSDKEIQDFLIWLGVNKEPKLIKIPNFSEDPYSSFLDHILAKLFSDKEYLIFNHGTSYREVNRNKLKKLPNEFEIQTIDRLEEVINNAYPELIIAWIYKDKRFSKDNFKPDFPTQKSKPLTCSPVPSRI